MEQRRSKRQPSLRSLRNRYERRFGKPAKHADDINWLKQKLAQDAEDAEDTEDENEEEETDATTREKSHVIAMETEDGDARDIHPVTSKQRTGASSAWPSSCSFLSPGWESSVSASLRPRHPAQSLPMPLWEEIQQPPHQPPHYARPEAWVVCAMATVSNCSHFLPCARPQEQKKT